MIYKGYAGAGNRIIFHLEESEDDENENEICDNFPEPQRENQE